MPTLITPLVKDAVYCSSLKFAVSERSSVMVTVHPPEPLQAPPQDPNVDPASAVGVRVTIVPSAKSAAQVAPQLMPAGVLVTVPLPPPVLLTLRVCCWTGVTGGVNCAAAGGVMGTAGAVRFRQRLLFFLLHFFLATSAWAGRWAPLPSAPASAADAVMTVAHMATTATRRSRGCLSILRRTLFR